MNDKTMIKEIFKSDFDEMNININSPFIQALQTDDYIQVSSTNMHKAIYNLIISKRDLRLWNMGMKPNIHWKVSVVKKYFGLKGKKNVLVDQIEFLVNYFNN